MRTSNGEVAVGSDYPDAGGRVDAAGDVLRELVGTGDRLLMTSFPQGAVFMFDEELRYLAAGGRGLADVGLSREMLEGQTIFEVFPPETADQIEPLYRAALAGESSTTDIPYEGRIYSQRLAPVTDAAGRIVAGLGFTQDVTEARRAESALRESEQRLRLTFQHAPMGEAIVELDGRWRAVNPALTKLLGYSEADLMTMSFQDVTHPEDLDLDLGLLGRLVAGEIPDYQMEKRYLTATGLVVWVLLSVSLVRDESGEPLYFISQILDITELKRQQEALRDLTAMLAHDLRTPATVISGFADYTLARWDGTPEEKRREALQRIAAAARTMRGLLDNSLTASALEARGLTCTPEAVRLVDAVDAALAGVPDVDLEVDTSGLGDAEAWVDRGHLTQVLANLVTNAAKYGGGRLALVATPGVGDVEVEVCDDGPGVDAAFVPHLFERFSREESARAGTQRGSGLGLYIVRDLLSLNGGSITYRAPDGGGACFLLTLPRPRPLR